MKRFFAKAATLSLLIGSMSITASAREASASFWAEVEAAHLTIDGTDLGPTIEKGSLWTDGMNFYKVSERKGEYKLEGGTLHEGGGEARIKRGASGLSVLPYNDEFDFSPFGNIGDEVLHRKMSRYELLIAHPTDNPGVVTGVLVRYNGDELEYELQNMRALLAGVYQESNGWKWEFNANGTATIQGATEPVPYQFELEYDMPTNIIGLPGGKHYVINVTGAGIELHDAVFNTEEDAWEPAQEPLGTPVVTAKRKARQPDIAWASLYVIALNSSCLLSTDYLERMATALLTSSDPLARLNAMLICDMLREREKMNADDEGVG